MNILSKYKDFIFENIENDVDKFIKYCEDNIDLNHKLGPEYYYYSITSAIIDAVYSLGITYAQTKKVVERYNEYYNLKMYRDYGSDFSPESGQDSTTDLIERIKEIGIDEIAVDVFKNRCRTSTHKSSILKSEAVLMFAEVLKKYGVEYLQDINKTIGNKDLENEIRSIPGQTTRISLEYFYMLTGYDYFVKIDRHMLRFFSDAVGYHSNKYGMETGKYVVETIKKAIKVLRIKYKHMTPRLLDHQLWLFQKTQKGYDKNKNVKI